VVRRLAILVMTVLALGGGVLHTYSYRYRLTLVVNDNGKLYSGSSVVEVKSWDQGTLQGSEIDRQLTGQATLVDLGHGRLLVALLTGPGRARPKDFYKPAWGDDPTAVLQEAYGLKVGWPVKGEPNIPILAQEQGARNLPPEKLPALVTFLDSQNPATVTTVDARDLSSVFGPGVALQSATIEITNEPITTGITNRLPWLVGRRGYIDGQATGIGVPYMGDQFVRGVR
jgi:hypothetical protein